MTYKFKVGDTGLTRNGTPYEVLRTNFNGDQPLVVIIPGTPDIIMYCSSDGSFYYDDKSSGWDLIPPVAPPEAMFDSCGNKIVIGDKLKIRDNPSWTRTLKDIYHTSNGRQLAVLTDKLHHDTLLDQDALSTSYWIKWSPPPPEAKMSPMLAAEIKADVGFQVVKAKFPVAYGFQYPNIGLVWHLCEMEMS